jgi:hypothetical protein
MIIRNDASDLFFFAYLAGRPAKARQTRQGEAGPPRRGRPMTDDRSTGNASVYHILSRFLPFTGTIADI